MTAVDILGLGFPVLAILSIIILALLAGYLSTRYQVVGPDEALIVAGAKGSKIRSGGADEATERAAGSDQGIRVVVGGGAIVLPLVNKASKLSLRVYQSPISLADGVSAQGIRIKVNGNAVYKVGRTADQVRLAAERFLGRSDEAIEQVVREILTGSLRSIVGKLTIEELVRDRNKLQAEVSDQARKDLDRIGIELDALNVQDISDEGFSGQQSYIAQIGLQNFVTAERDAKIAKAQADREAAVAAAEAQKEIIDAQRDQSLRAAEAKAQTDAAERKAAQAGPLAEAQAAQEVTRKKTELALLEAERREKELLATTVKQAEADAEAARAKARGERDAKIAGAQAEAASIFARGQAEAEAMALRAEAFQAYNEAAIITAVLERLPDIVREAAAPMNNIDSLTVLSTDGASEVVRNTTRTVTEASSVLRGMTGIDLPEMIGKARGAATSTDRPSERLRAAADRIVAARRPLEEVASDLAPEAEEASIERSERPAPAEHPEIEFKPAAPEPAEEPRIVLEPTGTEPARPPAGGRSRGRSREELIAAGLAALPDAARGEARLILGKVPSTMDELTLGAVPLPAVRAWLARAPKGVAEITIGELRRGLDA